jgi:putative ABC transport system permease protein
MFDRFLSEIRVRLRALFQRNQLERDLDDELRFHLEREVAKHRQAGLSPEEAARRARAAFGSVSGIKDDARDARGLVWLETIVQDLRYAVRGLRNRKTFAAGVVLTLALGIGANATMFGVVDRVLFRAPPTLRDPGPVHRLYRHRLDEGEPRIDRNYSVAIWQDLLRDTKSFSQMAAFQTRRLPLGEGEGVQEMPVTVASASFFEFFDVRPHRGRFYAAAEDSLPAGQPVVVLGYSYWITGFGGRDVIGQPLRVDRTVRTIIGVAPPGFVGMSDQGVPAAWIPITNYAFALRGNRYSGNYNWSWLELIARRAPGIERERAEADLTAAFQASWRRAAAQDPGWGTPENARVRAELGPVQVERGPQAGPESKVAAWVSGVALIVLVIACANVANLLLARAVSRRREIALRLALGVSRARLVRQLIAESFVLAVLGGMAGLAIAQWGAGSLRRWFLGHSLDVSVLTDTRTLFFTAVTIGVTGLLTGLVPALHAARGDVADALKTGGRDGAYQRSRIRPVLLVIQCALSVVLLVGAGLFVRSLGHVRNYRLGYDPDRVLYAVVNGRGDRPTPVEQMALNQRLLEAARVLPGVSHVSQAASVPFWSNEGRGLYVPGVDSVDRRGRFILQAGSPDYFATMGTRILRGRAFDETDREGTAPVVVVSEGMARAIWPGRDPLGVACVRIGDPAAPCATVIGVAEDMRVRNLIDAREFSYYIPAWQYDGPLDPQLFVRVEADPAPLVEPLRRRLQSELSGPAYVKVMPLTDLVDPNLRSWRMGATLFVAFGGLALLLAAIGLYSMIAYDVAQRTRDLGVRLALGARGTGVMRLVVAGGLRLTLLGLVLGGITAFLAAPLLEPLMFSQPPRDPVILAAVAGLLLVVGVVASFVPGLRAARVDPVVALRED